MQGLCRLRRAQPGLAEGRDVLGDTAAPEDGTRCHQHVRPRVEEGAGVLGGAGLAFVQSDIKKVLAYSTVSQLGYMVMALGVGAWTAALFHLFTHAFFKACLFLGAGSVSHACHHSFDMVADMGGLRKYMPHTYKTFMIGSIALAGLPPLAGFWSKDEILAGAQQLGGGGNGYPIILAMGMITAFLTAAYTTRMVYLTFFGEYRGHGEPHESPKTITVPLWILAVLDPVAGFANLPSAIAPDAIAYRFTEYVEPVAGYFPAIPHADFVWWFAGVATLVAAAGVAVGYVYWFQGRFHGLTERNKLAAAGYRVLENKYYLDWLYTTVIVGAIKGPIARASNWINANIVDSVVNAVGTESARIGRRVYRHIDQQVVDGAVLLSGEASSEAGGLLRLGQTGKIRHYATIMFAGATVLAGVLVVIV